VARATYPVPPLINSAANSHVIPSNGSNYVAVRIVLFGAFRPYHYGQCVRGFVRRLEFHDSTFLHPFAPPELPGFNATMSALTPGCAVLRLAIEHERRPYHAQVSPLTGWYLPTIPPPDTFRRTLGSLVCIVLRILNRGA